MMPTVVFDLDGTLADTSGDLLGAANSCFRDLGLGNLLGPDDKGTALKGGRAMLRLGFSRVAGFDETDVDANYQPLLWPTPAISTRIPFCTTVQWTPCAP